MAFRFAPPFDITARKKENIFVEHWTGWRREWIMGLQELNGFIVSAAPLLILRMSIYPVPGNFSSRNYGYSLIFLMKAKWSSLPYVSEQLWENSAASRTFSSSLHRELRCAFTEIVISLKINQVRKRVLSTLLERKFWIICVHVSFLMYHDF